MGEAIVALIMVGGFGFFAVLVGWSIKKERDRKAALARFAAGRNLSAIPELPESPWAGHFAFQLFGARSRYEDIYGGTVDGVPLVICNARGHGKQSSTSPATLVVVPLEGENAPELFLVPGKITGMARTMFEFVGRSMGIEFVQLPPDAPLDQDYSVIARANYGVGEALAELDTRALAEQPPRGVAMGKGWLVVFAESPSGRPTEPGICNTEDELEQLLASALTLKGIVERWG